MKPEQYWIERGRDVIGTDVLREGVGARQAATYQAIVRWIIEHGITQVLDVGANVAALYMFLHMADYRGLYVGVDTNPNVQSAACVNVNVGDLRNLEFGDQEFECVVVKDVIEHLESYEPLAEAFRVARKYVILAVYLPFTNDEPIIQQHADGYYLNRYKRQDVLAFAKRCGFEFCDVSLDLFERDGAPNTVWCWRRA